MKKTRNESMTLKMKKKYLKFIVIAIGLIIASFYPKEVGRIVAWGIVKYSELKTPGMQQKLEKVRNHYSNN